MKRSCAILILSMLENDSDPVTQTMAKEIVRWLRLDCVVDFYLPVLSAFVWVVGFPGTNLVVYS